MNVDPSLAVSVLVLVATIFVIAVIYRPRNHDQAWTRLQQRLDDFEQAQSIRDRELEQRFVLAQRLHREDQSQLLQQMERRLTANVSAQANASEQLRTDLLERVENHKSALSALLSDGNLRSVRTLGELNNILERRHSDSTKHLNESLANGLQVLQRQLADSLSRNSVELGQRVTSHQDHR